MTKHLEDLQERFENGEFDDNEFIDLLIHYKKENCILAEENKKKGEENIKLHHYKLLYQNVKERNDKAIEYINDNWDGSSYFDSTLKGKVAELNISELEEILKGNNEEATLIEITHDLKNIVISALRYALGRKTYITQETAEFIMSNPDLIDERVCIVMLRDIGRYFEDRELWQYKDDECDYKSWLALQNWLFKIAKEKDFNVIGYERRYKTSSKYN